MSNTRIEVMNPVARLSAEGVLPARRLEDLNGKTIGLWWNTKPHGDVALAAVRQALEQRFTGMTFVTINQNFPHDPDVYETVTRGGCDAVIAATAD